jgi:hypothetical protein
MFSINFSFVYITKGFIFFESIEVSSIKESINLYKNFRDSCFLPSFIKAKS